jgi:hypothetical protein
MALVWDLVSDLASERVMVLVRAFLQLAAKVLEHWAAPILLERCGLEYI